MERRLAAIMATDVVGYSRLIRADEEGTIAALQALRADLIDPKIAEHHGRIVKLMGDGMLVEFGSVVDAVHAAVETQQAVTDHNADVPADKRIELRIGINLGDVVIDGDDIQGDGINVAARLEGMAEPGGICVSGMVYEGVRDRIDVPFEDLGEQEVKNIDRPVRVWRWVTDGSAAVVSRQAAEPLPLPDKPSIAVLPFTNISCDPEQEYFSDGITEDIITALSKIKKLFVVARNSTFTYKGQAVDVKRVGREQGVRYVLEGSVRRGGNRLRITAQLIDAATSNHLWAERYDRESSDVFALQDEITREVASALQVELTEGEQARLWASGTKNLEAWELVIQANHLIHRHHWEDTHEARRLLEQAIRLDENYATAWELLGVTHWTDAINEGWSDSRETSLARALEAIDQALAIDPSNPDTLSSLSLIKLTSGNHDEALALSEKAVALAPNHANNMAVAGVISVYCGKPQEALKLVRKAMRLSPVYPIWYLYPLTRAYWFMGETNQALAAARSAIERDAEISISHLLHAIVLTDAGRDAEAQRAAAEVLRLEPNFSVEAWAARRGTPTELSIREAEALRKTGLPE
ncbi:MAG: adenylate/guanylate cyclase domain-containing protein [Proteobacteria bacterium]|nr:adenylate/guanylate cyclase domain-containing protein [Pseudomonadota bacterium]